MAFSFFACQKPFQQFARAILFGGLVIHSSLTLAEKPAVKVAISPETTGITKPLQADGYPDYVAAANEVAAQGITPENNAAVLIWQAMGPKELNDLEPAAREQYFKLLGISPLSETGEYFVDFDDFVAQHPEYVPKNDAVPIDPEEWAAGQFLQAESQPWTEEELPSIAVWLAANEKPLQLLKAAAKRPKIYWPLVRVDNSAEEVAMNSIFNTLGNVADASNIFAIQALLNIGNKKYQAACDDILVHHRLARLVAQGPFFIDGLVASIMYQTTFKAQNILLASEGLSALQAQAMKGEIRNASHPLSFASYLTGLEWYCGLDSLCHRTKTASLADVDILEEHVYSYEEEQALKRFANKFVDAIILDKVDWNQVFRAENAVRLEILSAWKKPSYTERREALLAITAKSADATLSRTQLLVDANSDPTGKKVTASICKLFTYETTYRIVHWLNFETQSKTLQHLLEVGYALATYKAKYGNYPDKLRQLIPDCIRRVPNDPFTDRDFVYYRDELGYTLYSVGVNGLDDGSKNWSLDEDYSSDEEATTNEEADDIRLCVPVR